MLGNIQIFFNPFGRYFWEMPHFATVPKNEYTSQTVNDG